MSSAAEKAQVDNGPPAEPCSILKTSVVILSVSSVTFLNCFVVGLIVVQVPTIAEDIGLSTDLLLWPISINAAVTSCTLLLMGSIADVAGCKRVFLSGWVFKALCTLATGLSRTVPEFFVFYGLSGFAYSFSAPTAVSIITTNIPAGRKRNFAVAAMGAGEPIGFGFGLVSAGVFVDTLGWRWAFYISAIIYTAIFLAILLFQSRLHEDKRFEWSRVISDIDWIGTTTITSASLLFYCVLVSVTVNADSVRRSYNIVFLCMALLALIGFAFWEHRQERLGRPAMIPNSLWRKLAFTSICLAVLFTWGSFNATEMLMTLYFQKVQNLSAFQTSLRFLPDPVTGAAAGLIVGAIAHKVSVRYYANLATAITAISPLLMSLAKPRWPYWPGPFLAVALNPACAGALFTSSNLVITSAFPSDKQALAGAVFQMFSQLGTAIGMAIVPPIAAGVTASVTATGRSPNAETLFQGYQAAFWFCFALAIVAVLICFVGLFRVGRVGAENYASDDKELVKARIYCLKSDGDQRSL